MTTNELFADWKRKVADGSLSDAPGWTDDQIKAYFDQYVQDINDTKTNIDVYGLLQKEVERRNPVPKPTAPQNTVKLSDGVGVDVKVNDLTGNKVTTTLKTLDNKGYSISSPGLKIAAQVSRTDSGSDPITVVWVQNVLSAKRQVVDTAGQPIWGEEVPQQALDSQDGSRIQYGIQQARNLKGGDVNNIWMQDNPHTPLGSTRASFRPGIMSGKDRFIAWICTQNARDEIKPFYNVEWFTGWDAICDGKNVEVGPQNDAQIVSHGEGMGRYRMVPSPTSYSATVRTGNYQDVPQPDASLPLPSSQSFDQVKKSATKLITLGSHQLSVKDYSDLAQAYQVAMQNSDWKEAKKQITLLLNRLDTMNAQGKSYWKNDALKNQHFTPLYNKIKLVLKGLDVKIAESANI